MSRISQWELETETNMKKMALVAILAAVTALVSPGEADVAYVQTDMPDKLAGEWWGPWDRM